MSHAIAIRIAEVVPAAEEATAWNYLVRGKGCSTKVNFKLEEQLPVRSHHFFRNPSWTREAYEPNTS